MNGKEINSEGRHRRRAKQPAETMHTIKIGSTVEYLGRQFRVAGFTREAAILERLGEAEGLEIRVALKILESF